MQKTRPKTITSFLLALTTGVEAAEIKTSFLENECN